MSIGMAVDANVLIFERLKEELRAGRSLRVGIEAGFNRAWVAIRDSNVSTLIPAPSCGGSATSWDAAGNRVCDHAGHRRGNEHVLGDVRDQKLLAVRGWGPGARETGVVRAGQGRGSGGRGFNPPAWAEPGQQAGLVLRYLWGGPAPGYRVPDIPSGLQHGHRVLQWLDYRVRFINPSDLSRLTTGAVTSQAVREVLEELGHGEAIVQALEATRSSSVPRRWAKVR